MPLILGHRGFRGRIENTIPAFKRAMKYANGVELDVWKAGDGRIIVRHDETIDGISVRDLTFCEIKRKDSRIPTLRRVLKELRGAIFDIDIKDIDAVEGSVDLVEHFGVKAIFSADTPEIVHSLQRECPDCRIGFSITAYSSLLAIPRLGSIHSLHVPIDTVSYVGFRNVVSLMRFFRKRGLRMFLWNYQMDELVWVPRFLPFVDAVISDDPARLRKVLLASEFDNDGGELYGGLE